MSEQHRTIANDATDDILHILNETFQSLLISISRLENRNKELRTRVAELEELLKIAKGAKNE